MNALFEYFNGKEFKLYGATPFLEVISGSYSYGMENENSDYDVFSIIIPSSKELYPSNYGYINGYDEPELFESFSKQDLDANIGKRVDLSVHSIQKYFRLISKANPNFFDVLFVDDEFVRYASEGAKYLRDNRNEFLSKKVYTPYRGYAYGEYLKVNNKKDILSRDKFYKSCYHSARLYYQMSILFETGKFITNFKKTDYYDTLKNIKFGKMDSFECLEVLEHLKEGAMFSFEYNKGNIKDEIDKDRVKEILKECLCLDQRG